ITNTDGSGSYIPGSSTTYTIVVTSVGPGNASGAGVTFILPPLITGATWTCSGTGGATCTASGTGSITDTVNIPAGGSLTYTVNASISSAATGNLTNTATAAVAADTADTVPGNNSATDTDTSNPRVDLSLTKTDGSATYIPGGSITYTIVASNAG